MDRYGQKERGNEGMWSRVVVIKLGKMREKKTGKGNNNGGELVDC